MPELIEIQDNPNNIIWDPFVGDETMGLLMNNPKFAVNGELNRAGKRVLDETVNIMKICGNPNVFPTSKTGIVIGYIQSGKTLSFTTLTALARDNNFQIVIVIGGISKILLNQSTDRLRRELRIDNRYGNEQKWIQITNPEKQDHFDIMSNIINQWADPNYPNDRCKTLLITVMKHGNRLLKLERLLKKLTLKKVPTLIIDDEGDQASLNTRARTNARRGVNINDLTEDDVSMIYCRINSLRNILPHNTFLQYTATPQANLFINIFDRLSPNFVKFISPGDEYTGGITFFDENNNLIVEIPPSDLPQNGQLNEAPRSLLKALQIFYLGVAVGNHLGNTTESYHRNRSMLIHPSRLQGDHNTFYSWINNIKKSWTRLLSGGDNEDKQELLNEFLLAYEDLKKTVKDLPSFEKLISNELIQAIQYTPIVEVNARQGNTPQIQWQNSYSWILVGGQSMDRGFTVEGLTVTYMPRNIGVGNVDTIQQRARFYGYKKNYLGFCRVFLDQITIESYKNIIEHEDDVRNQLNDFDFNNLNLNEWNRKTILDRLLNLTRPNILYDELNRANFGDMWFRIKAPHDTEEFIKENLNVLMNYLETRITNFVNDIGHTDRTDEQKHLVATLKINDILKNLLNNLKFTQSSDSANYSSLRGILKRYLIDHPNENCKVYLMSARGLNDWTKRVRKLGNNGIQQLFQGRNPKVGEIIYPGDSEIKDGNMLTIQIHLLNLRNTVFTNVPTLAIWIPKNIGVDIIEQSRNEQI